MSAKIVSCLVLFAAGSLAGCGFKSDLFLPEEEDEGLFGRDAPTEQPALPDESELNDLSNLVDSPFRKSGEVVDEKIMLEKVTTVATEGDILVPAGSNSQSAEGIPVDLTEVTREVESRRNNN